MIHPIFSNAVWQLAQSRVNFGGIFTNPSNRHS
jgi:hypothetical protein